MALGRAPLDGSEPAHVLSTEDGIRNIAVDATYVYWTNRDGSIRRIAK